MDKKDGGTIDLESLRGFTPRPWSLGRARTRRHAWVLKSG